MTDKLNVNDFPTYDDVMSKFYTKEQLNEIDTEAKACVDSLRILQDDLAKAVTAFMVSENIGFNELGRRLGMGPRHVTRIIKGSGNVTMETVARVAALIKKKPQLNFV